MKRNEEFEDMYRRGLDYYIEGDWMNAQTQWQTCSEITGMKHDGPLRHMLEVIDKAKVQAPEGWNQGYDWDLKPEPPDIEYIGSDGNSSSKDSKDGK